MEKKYLMSSKESGEVEGGNGLNFKTKEIVMSP